MGQMISETDKASCIDVRKKRQTNSREKNTCNLLTSELHYYSVIQPILTDVDSPLCETPSEMRKNIPSKFL